MTHVITLRPGLLGSDQSCWVIFGEHRWVSFGKRRRSDWRIRFRLANLQRKASDNRPWSADVRTISQLLAKMWVGAVANKAALDFGASTRSSLLTCSRSQSVEDRAIGHRNHSRTIALVRQPRSLNRRNPLSGVRIEREDNDESDASARQNWPPLLSKRWASNFWETAAILQAFVLSCSRVTVTSVFKPYGVTDA